ncbi:pilus assembly protein [Oxalobacteraceae bacterium R-40]|uniref:Pilus assembly protein n=1 Tax=Keguizhuia sedimenti TaxID=3064264 RepID=A0ABU1BKF4_9BURK|nr:pilus assembly protein [Oxalobacteraceae bacterium R-40]
MSTRFINYSRQRGVAAVEFAIIAPVFFILLIGIMELGRVLFYMNSAAEATRFGARIAVVCDMDAAGIRSRMISRLHILEPEHIAVQYNPAGCGVGSCQSVTVSIDPSEVVMDTVIPFLGAGFSVVMPAFSTTLPRESLRTEIVGEINPLCVA